MRSALLCIFLFIQFSVFSQPANYKFGRIDVSNGLSNNQVLAVFKDSRGFMWFGTSSGLNRYDGYSFKSFKHNIHDALSISDNYIDGISEDQNGRLWISTRSVFNIYDPLTGIFQRNIPNYLGSMGIPFSNINYLYKDKSGSVWYLNRTGGFARYNKLSGKIELIQHNPKDSSSIRSGNLSSIIEDNDGYFWIIHIDGILEKFDNKKIDPMDINYRRSLLYLLLSQTSCFRYWGSGIWTDYAKEITRRGMEALGKV
jgi:ligand-binding sensor domain-containing protein